MPLFEVVIITGDENGKEIGYHGPLYYLKATAKEAEWAAVSEKGGVSVKEVLVRSFK